MTTSAWSGVAHKRDERAAQLFDRRPDAGAREELVRLYYSLGEYLARRYNGRGDNLDDLVQVASIGLLKSIDRFDASRGVRFVTFAVPTIVGELKRHFRATGWALRVPRGLKERALQIRAIVAELDQELGRSPTVAEIAARAASPEETVIEALQAFNAYTIASLDTPADAGEQSEAELLGDEDRNLEITDGWVSVAPFLRALAEDERRPLYYRFVVDLSQAQIAEILGVSQMHVSRTLARTIAHLRTSLGEASPPRPTPRRNGVVQMSNAG